MTTAEAGSLEEQLASVFGVSEVSANPRTRNVLLRFDPRMVDADAVLRRVTRALARRRPANDEDPPATPARTRGLTHAPRSRRARIAVHGLDRDPHLARRLVERLEVRDDVVRVTPSPLTGRILVELAEAGADLDAILAEVVDLEPPAEPGEPHPAHPLDPAPLIEASAKLIGAAAGLLLLGVRRSTGRPLAPLAGPGPGEIAGAVGLLEGIPSVVDGIEDALGHERKELLFGAIGIVSTTFSGGALGLAYAAATAAPLLGETLARRAAWRDYEERVGHAPPAYPGARLEVRPGERVPLPATVLRGTGTALGADGLPVAVHRGTRLEAGSRIFGGPVRVRLRGGGTGFSARAGPPPEPERRELHDRYMGVVGFAAIAYALATFALTRSWRSALTAALLVNPRAALAGHDAVDRAASARAMRAGATVVGSRAARPVRRPDVLVLDSPRVLVEGWELDRVIPAADGGLDVGAITRIAGWISVAAGSPWGTPFPLTSQVEAHAATFDGETAAALVDGTRWLLQPVRSPRGIAGGRRPDRGHHVLALRPGLRRQAVGYVLLRPRLAPGLRELRDTCRRLGVGLEVVVSSKTTGSARVLARRAAIRLVTGTTSERIRYLQAEGAVVAVLADGGHAAEAFELADLAIALTSGRSGRFHARADVLAPRLEAVAPVIETGALRDQASREVAWIAVVGNVGGAGWGLATRPRFRRGTLPSHVAGVVAVAHAAVRLRGGHTPRSVSERLTDPAPERWGAVPTGTVLHEFSTSADGLSTAEAERRWVAPEARAERHPAIRAVLDQVRSPVVAVLSAGAGLSLAMGALGDVAMIAAVIVANAAVSAWQEGQAGRAAEALAEMNTPLARVMRDDREKVVSAHSIVPGDVLVLAAGDRIAADARVLWSEGLEVDEAALTGESLPVVKAPDNGTESTRIVLAGTDVTSGRGRAVVVAAGRETRMGALAAALEASGEGASPLDRRLGEILWRGLPLIAAGGLLVFASGMAWGGALLPQLMLGASVAIAAVPEGLPLLAGVAQAGVARRLADSNALVARLASVEALGRVDVACADKTGTLTEGRLSVTSVRDSEGFEARPESLPASLRAVLEAAALASPRPGSAELQTHPTDAAVVDAAGSAGLGPRLDEERDAESPFDPARGFHATRVAGGVVVKGASEVVLAAASGVRRRTGVEPLDAAGRRELLATANVLSGRGLRVLMVAEGPERVPPRRPHSLTVLGFVCLSDPIKASVPAAVRRCTAAGIRVVMVTGDHPGTARAVAEQAGLAAEPENVFTGAELARIPEEELHERLERVTVIARVTPLDKVRIVEALQRAGHVVAMTGDGVNDAPALRLADVGVAMGSGTEVARRSADLVVTDNDFGTLGEALVEGRGFWQNMRRALALLLGGNAGEVTLVTAASLVGLGSPLNTRQILTVNLLTDVLPAVAVAIQPPAHRNLASLAREGGAALDAPLRKEIIQRAVATGGASFGAYVLASRTTSQPRARSVAFASIVTTQLGQALDLGRGDRALSGSVVFATAASLGVVVASMAVPQLRSFLDLALPGVWGAALALAAPVAAVLISRAWSSLSEPSVAALS